MKRYSFTTAQLGKLYITKSKLQKSKSDCDNLNCRSEKYRMEQAIAKLAQSFNELLELFHKQEKQLGQIVLLANSLSSNFSLPFKFNNPPFIELERFTNLANTIKHYYIGENKNTSSSSKTSQIRKSRFSSTSQKSPNQHANASQELLQLSRKRKEATQPLTSTKPVVHPYETPNNSSSSKQHTNIPLINLDESNSNETVAAKWSMVNRNPQQNSSPHISSNNLPPNNLQNGQVLGINHRTPPAISGSILQQNHTNSNQSISIMRPSSSNYHNTIGQLDKKLDTPNKPKLMLNHAPPGTCNFFYLEGTTRAFFANVPLNFNYEVHPRPFPASQMVSSVKPSHQPFLNVLTATLVDFNNRSDKAKVQLNADYEFKFPNQKLVLYYYLKVKSQPSENAQWQMHNNLFACNNSGKLTMTMDFEQINEEDIIFISCRLTTSSDLPVEQHLGQFSAPLVVQLCTGNKSKNFVADFKFFRNGSAKRSLNSTAATTNKSPADTEIEVIELSD